LFLSCVGDLILQEFNTLFLTRFRTYKIATPPKQKPRKGGGLRHINTCRKVPLQVNFFRLRRLALLSISLIFLRSYLTKKAQVMLRVLSSFGDIIGLIREWLRDACTVFIIQLHCTVFLTFYIPLLKMYFVSGGIFLYWLWLIINEFAELCIAAHLAYCC
jgi:hypothetical protein